ncbi:transcriptional regulator [Streptomyces dangxiongensis]|uniref:Transcriptional regulator n=1 Tax=Streptomyces dangxiongensis TaxID=1442032 RepID=A0A3G2JNC1_9ACTN|nr:LuxR C-terminal-related transcriptional regulator [Streptomyces dangxiongensis]AYN43061.1 transcriptional regulator [Streptomyces dangxiongensis]
MTGQTPLGPAPRYRPGPQRHVMAALWDRLRGEGACVVTGDPGSGRSAFLAWAAGAFTAGPVVTVPADPTWSRRPRAGLSALCHAAGVPAGAVRAADPEREIIGALGATATAPPRTVLLCVDDAHLWDAPSRAVLGRLAARLAGGSRVVLLLSVAGHRPVDPEFAGLPLLRLDPLAPQDAASLLDDAAQGALDRAVRDEISAAAEGNPALLLRLLHRLTPAELRGLAPLPRPLADTGALTALAGRHLAGPLPGQRDLLLVTAAALQASGEPTVEAELVRRATARLTGHTPWPDPPADPRPTAAGLTPDPRTRPHHIHSDATGPAPRLHHADSDATGPAQRPLRADRATSPGSGAQPPAPDSAECHSDPRLVALPASLDHLEPHPGPRPRPVPLPESLVAADGRLGFRSGLLCRTVYASAPAERRRAAHDALAGVLPDGRGLPALLHRSWAVTAPDPSLAAGLAAAASDPAPATPPALRCTAHTRAAELTPDGTQQARWYTAAAEQALLAGQSARALRLLDAVRSRPAPPALRARAELLRGTVLRWDGPVDDAHETLLLAAASFAPHDPERSAEAALDAADAAWSAGDLAACLRALAEGPTRAPSSPGTCGGDRPTRPGHMHPPAGQPLLPPTDPRLPTRPARGAVVPSAVLRDHRAGLRAVLLGHFGEAAAPLRRVVNHAWTADAPERPPHARDTPEPLPRTTDTPSPLPHPADDPERFLRAAAAALLLGDTAAARRAGARALAVARTHRCDVHEAQALEYLAYGELRAGRHALARTHAEEGLRTAYRTGRRNTAAHHHAVLALAASIEGDALTVAEHVTAALAVARGHGLAQAAALAQWATARADLGHGRPREAAERLGPLVRPGPGRGHFAVWMLAVPCYVEACALAGQPEQARDAVEDFARWTACDADPQAPAQLLRCRALLASPETADPLYRQALRRHEEAAGDFERARTELLYGKWLRRRRRLREARIRLRAAQLGFERCGARPWAQQAVAELRANGVAGVGGAVAVGGAVPRGDGVRSDPPARLTPQQLRIARGVAQGLTNREVALSLSVSTRTVDYHLRNIFSALGVRSRMELARLLARTEKSAAHL